MSLVKRLLRREDQPETKCPRCGTPAPSGTVDCAACGWDFREQFRGVSGSTLDDGDEGVESAHSAT